MARAARFISLVICSMESSRSWIINAFLHLARYNVVLEAQASGIPVIVTDNGGPQKNIIPGKTGLVVNGKDTKDLAKAMETMIYNKKMRENMGKAAHVYMQERSFEKAFEETWELYTKVKPAVGC